VADLSGTPDAAIDVTETGEIAVVMAGGKARAELTDPYAFQRALEQAVARRAEIRAPGAEHLGPVAGDD
jgi:hypothetical protein